MRSITARQSASRVTSSACSTPGRPSRSLLIATPPPSTMASATTEPMPAAAPVTRTILSSKRIMTSSGASSCRVAAVEQKIGAGGEGAVVRQQKDGQGGDFLWRAEPVERDVAAEARSRAGRPARGGGGVVEHRALDERRRDRIAANRRRQPRAVERNRPGQHVDTALGRRIGDHVVTTDAAEDR